ncbi:non-hydrolyzing UDP-N-acetylglucosamine 2-epimerase [Sphingomonas profundi]|uniref:non-hydrolyzing UDP-N-acetylglucosamine 2-epimerase n=1 Tax=Alterirhizorhabdus profundi TaxID=2681549 RepID=UPI0012E87C5E|nr:UDP-N-acetylglucosamine 2-epimerase (non-hydrolyzing) [Sphingomonas profundi]
MLRLLTIAGTRPEAIKLAPLALAAAARPGIDHRLVATGQHGALFHDALAAFHVAADADMRLLVQGQSIEALAALVGEGVARAIADVRPHVLLVQGDTTSAWAAARAAYALGVPVGHIEAGLRSGDMASPWPEERNRVEIDALATLLFAPTHGAAANLAGEPGIAGEVAVTGNTGIDALLAIHARPPAPAIRPGARRLILATTHRRENIGAGIAGICAALRALARRPDVDIVLPVHPNPAVQAQILAALSGCARIDLPPALDYPAMVRLMARAHLILSDSGGVQEEAPALGVPLLVLRENSERPEVLESGNARLVGTDPARILAAAEAILDDPAAHAAMARPAFPYGRGDAAERILDAIEDWHAARSAGALAVATPASTLAIARPLAQGSAAKGQE